jgi:hypothetical protein
VYSLWNLRRRRAAQNRERQADDSAAQGITRPPISSVEMPQRKALIELAPYDRNYGGSFYPRQTLDIVPGK